MKPNDLLKQISVKIESPSQGSGVLYFSEEQEDKIYILTAKHCICESESDIVVDNKKITISYFSSTQEGYIKYTLDEEDMVLFFDKKDDIDLAILCVPKSALNISSNFSIELLENGQDFKKAFVWGFPNSGEEQRILKNVDVNISYPDISHFCELQSHLNTDQPQIISTIEGMSGGAVVIIEDKKVLLLGINTDFDDSWYRFKGVKAIMINTLLGENNFPTEPIITYENNQEIRKGVRFFRKETQKIIEIIESKNTVGQLHIEREELCNRISKSVKENNSVIINGAPGFGKSVLGAKVLRKLEKEDSIEI